MRRQLAVLVDGVQGAGDHSVTWDAGDLGATGGASGVYFARLEAGDVTSTEKLVLVR